MSKTDEKKAQEQQQAVLTDGRFAATEDGDNAVDVSNDEYIGVDPEYRNSAYDTDKPIAAEGDDPVADAAKASAEELSGLNVNRAGYTVPEVHRAQAGSTEDTDPNRGRVMTTPPQTAEGTPETTTTTTTEGGAEGSGGDGTASS